MLLPHLSSDVIVLVSRLLSGYDVFRLILCGNTSLSAKLFRSADEIVCEVPRFTAFPFPAYALPRLRKLCVSMVKIYEFYPIRLDGRSMLPLVPLNSLSELRLSCAQSFHVLELEHSHVLLETAFPCLTVLHLSGTTDMIQSRHFRGLPETLRSLHLSSSSFASTIRYLDILPLPRDLESLEIPSSVHIDQSHDNDGYAKLQWPVGLKRLFVDEFGHSSILRRLPPHLESCNIHFQAIRPERLLYSTLPETLTELRLSCMQSLVVVLNVPLNSKLRLLDVPVLVHPTEDETTLSKDECFPNLCILPPSVTFIRPLHKFIQNPNAHAPLVFLPPSMTSAALSSATIWMIPLLPPLLTSLSLPHASMDKISLDTLPRTLIKLGLGLTSGSALSKLPRTLKSLHASFPVHVKLTKSDLQHLPDQLEEFSLSLDELSDPQAVTGLPLSLQTLRLTATRLSKHISNLGSYIPHSVTDLRLSVTDLNPIWPQWIMQMQDRGVKLSILDIFPCTTENPAPPIDSSFLKRLSPSLQSLRVSATGNWTQNKDCLQSLPPSLHTLHVLPVSTNSPTTLTDDHFTRLPNTLTHLRVPTYKGLTTKFWKVIPRGILTIRFGPGMPPRDFGMAQDMYQSESKWQGIFKPDPTTETMDDDSGPL